MYFYENKSSDPLALGQYNGECAKMQQFLCILAHYAHFFTKVFINSRFFPQQLLCLCFCHLLRRHKFLISEHKTEMPCSRSHACLPCDLLCAHIAALRSKKSVSIPPCGKCSVNLSRLRYRLLTAWHFCFPGLFTNAKCGCWQYMQEKYLTTYDLLKRKYALQQPCHCCKALEFLIFIYGSIDYLIILHIIACII